MLPSPGDIRQIPHTCWYCIRSVYRRGIGRQMVQFALDQARSRGCTVMRFDTNIDNIPASHLYENMGFELVSTGKAMLNGILPVTLRYYEKKLD